MISAKTGIWNFEGINLSSENVLRNPVFSFEDGFMTFLTLDIETPQQNLVNNKIDYDFLIKDKLK